MQKKKWSWNLIYFFNLKNNDPFSFTSRLCAVLQILENEKNRRQEQFLTSLTPEAIASAQVELSSVFSGVLGSLLTNMLSKQPELVERHLAAARKPDPTKVAMVQEGIATAKNGL